MCNQKLIAVNDIFYLFIVSFIILYVSFTDLHFKGIFTADQLSATEKKEIVEEIKSKLNSISGTHHYHLESVQFKSHNQGSGAGVVSVKIKVASKDAQIVTQVLKSSSPLSITISTTTILLRLVQGKSSNQLLLHDRNKNSRKNF